jgi:putative N6-adenine-specific DNA methylase
MSDRIYFAACGKGLEAALVGELEELGALQVREKRGGASFRGDRALGYRASLWLRSAIRIQEQLLSRRVLQADDLYERALEVDWREWLHPDQTLAIQASVRDTPEIRHSGYAALKVKDAIVDQMRERHGRRPNVDTKDPDLPLKLVVKDGSMLLYRDWSGASLHKRGYRPIQVKSPLNEALAAGLILLSGWDKQSPLADPMCGSGTFPIEAAMMAADRAPGLKRAFPFERWHDHDATLWSELRAEAAARAKPTLDFPIEGSDHHGGALALARRAAQEAGVADLVRYSENDARDFVPQERPAIVTTNPPYDKRLGEGEDVIGSWKSLGNFLHRQCGGSTAWILSGNKALTQHLGLRVSLRVPVMNGPIDCRWLKYEVRARD